MAKETVKNYLEAIKHRLTYKQHSTKQTSKQSSHIKFAEPRPDQKKKSCGLKRTPTPFPQRHTSTSTYHHNHHQQTDPTKTIVTQAYILPDPDFEPDIPKNIGFIHPSSPVLADGCGLRRVPTPIPGVGGI